MGVLLALSASIGHGQPQRSVPIRQLAAPVTVSTVSLKTVAEVRAFADGRVLVNDLLGRAVLMLDAALGTPRIVLDSAAGAENSYGRGLLVMIPFVADSTLVIEGVSNMIRVIDPNGTVVRGIPLPARQRMDGSMTGRYSAYLTAPWWYGYPAIDAQRRLIFRRPAMLSINFGNAGSPYSPPPDSAFLYAMNLETLAVEVLTSFRIPLPFFQIPPPEPGHAPPLLFPRVDEWTVTADGSIALVRGSDYHVEWLLPDGSRRISASPLPHAWERLTSADKIRKADSLTTWRDSMTRANVAAVRPPLQARFDRYGGYVGTRTGFATPRPPFVAIPPAAWPDTVPAFIPHAVRADADGNLWIEKLSSSVHLPEAGPGALPVSGALYDVVNAEGRLVDRVQLPSGRWLVGFGPGGVLYLVARHGDGVRLERYHRPL